MLEIIKKIDWHQVEFPYNLEDLYFSTNYDTIAVKNQIIKKRLHFAWMKFFQK
jgi:hypothetical protein